MAKKKVVTQEEYVQKGIDLEKKIISEFQTPIDYSSLGVPKEMQGSPMAREGFDHDGDINLFGSAGDHSKSDLKKRKNIFSEESNPIITGKGIMNQLSEADNAYGEDSGSMTKLIKVHADLIHQDMMHIGVHVEELDLMPEYKTDGSSGMDLRAKLSSPYFRLYPGQRKLIPTGVYLDIPETLEGQIRSRSGLAHNLGIIVLNAPGTIDSDYKGQIFVNLMNTSNGDQVINNRDRIAQLVFAPVWRANLIQKEIGEFRKTKRSENGHGSTGIK